MPARCPQCYRRLGPGARCPADGRVAPVGTSWSHDPRPPRLPGAAGVAIGAQLGEGGFSVVWEGVRASGELVAVKVARAADSQVRARFAREAEALLAVGPPHVPRLYESGLLDDGRAFLVMERLPGGTLDTWLAALDQPPEVARVRGVLHAILVALEAVHARGLVHRDLKPENIFLADGPTPVARLIDFGLTWPQCDRKGARLTEAGMAVGTIEYMAPEQLAAVDDLDARTDLYAIGAIAFELMTLRPPFVGDDATIENGHLRLRPPRPRDLAVVDESLERLVLQCLAKVRDRRPHDASVLRRAVAQPIGGTTRLRAPTAMAAGSGTLAAARQPVVLLWIHGAVVSDAAALVARHRGFLARQRGGGTLYAFSSLLGAEPAQAAVAAARDVVARGATRAALHIFEAALRRRDEGPPLVHGRDVDRPDTWLPAAEWQGLLCTREFLRALPARATRPTALSGFSAVVDVDEAPPPEPGLVGREDVLARVAAGLGECLTSGTPSLLTIVAERGVGRSRLARAIGDLARATGADVWEAQPRQATPGALDDTVAWLLAALTEGAPAQPAPASRPLAVRAVGDGLRRRAASAPLVLIVDDAHLADDVLLDALEYATLDGAGVRLSVVVLADPRLVALRPTWGTRAHRHVEVPLLPLEPLATTRLTQELLLPADFIPADAVQRIAAWSAGNPADLRDLVAVLKREGIVRPRAHGDGWYVATALLDQLPASPPAQWLALRELDAMPAELAACARVCAVLGADLERDELEWVLAALDEQAAASTPVDVDAGLAELVQRGVLRDRLGSFQFRSPGVQDACARLVAPADRARIHLHAAAWWRTRLGDRGDEALARVARHAAGAALGEEAARAHLLLAARARAGQRHVHADEHYTAALDLLAPSEHTLRLEAFAGRGNARYRLHRSREARADLATAHELAAALGDDRTLAGVLLEEATAADWAEDYAASTAFAEQARRLVERLGVPALDARCLMALGRTRWRTGTGDPIPPLREAVERATLLADQETRVIALLLLAPALVCAGRLDEAERRFEEVIAACERAEDLLHLCAAYGNRMFLWSARRAPDQAVLDLRRAIQLAREVGHPGPERVATFNLAEVRYWSGDLDEALTLARRAHVLHRRFGEHDSPHDALLLARIQAARGEATEARELAGQAAASDAGDLSSSTGLLVRAVMLALDAAGERTAWHELHERARQALAGEELLEIAWWRAHTAIQAGAPGEAAAVLEDARPLLVEWPIWRLRFVALAQRLAASGGYAPPRAS